MSYLSYIRLEIEKQYEKHPTGCGGSFGELLCFEIHERGLTFTELAKYWNVSLSSLGELIKDHCDRMQHYPKINFKKLPKLC